MRIFWDGLNPNIRYAAYMMLAFVLWMFTGLFSFGEDDAPMQADAPRTVRTQHLTQQPFARVITLMGRTQAETLATVSAEVDGIITMLHADAGDVVTKGDILAEIDLGTRPAKLEEARARLKEAETLYAADKRLNKEGFRADTQLATRKAELASAQATIAQMEKNIADSHLKSPIDGQVEQRHVNVGDFVAVGAPLFDVINLKSMKLVGYVAQNQRNLLEPGLVATGKTVDGQTVTGVVQFIANNADPRTKTYAVEVRVDRSLNDWLKSGMTTEISIPTPVRPAHFIPHVALVLNDKGDVGVMVAEQEKARFYPITPLNDTDTGMWVNGLPEQVDLIVTGQATLVDGAAITTQEHPVTLSGDIL